MATPYDPVHGETILVETTMWTQSAHRRRTESAGDDPNQCGHAYSLSASIARNEAAWTRYEIPVPSAMYAAKQAGHFGSNARISVGSENFASANPRCLADDGWALPSAVLLEMFVRRSLWFGSKLVLSSVTLIPAAGRSSFLRRRSSPEDSGHDGGPMTSKSPGRLHRDPWEPCQESCKRPPGCPVRARRLSMCGRDFQRRFCKTRWHPELLHAGSPESGSCNTSCAARCRLVVNETL